MERSLAGWPSKDPLCIRCVVQALGNTDTIQFAIPIKLYTALLPLVIKYQFFIKTCRCSKHGPSPESLVHDSRRCCLSSE